MITGALFKRYKVSQYGKLRPKLTTTAKLVITQHTFVSKAIRKNRKGVDFYKWQNTFSQTLANIKLNSK